MKFKKRTTAPSTSDKYWIHTSKGGLNSCIKIKDESVLPNCFSGDTKIITRNGLKRLDELVEQQIEVLSFGGVYRKAYGKQYGNQKLYEITFDNGFSYKVTANHRWLVKKISYYKDKKYEKYIWKTTLELNRNDYIPYNKIDNIEIDKNGIINGFIYGDGSFYNNQKYSKANLCGEKRNYMKKYFLNSKHIIQNKNGTIECYPYPREYKGIPNTEHSLSYLKGFIIGLLASDGCVDKDGHITISTVKKDDSLKISEICSVLGIKNSIYEETRDTNYKKESILYRITLFKSFLEKDMFLNPEHKRRFVEKSNSKNRLYTRVEEIKDLNIKEEVYCVEEKETHTITLVGNILTGQCVGYSWGRSYELLGSKPNLARTNAETWWRKKDGYKRGQTPKLGAIACWRKGSDTNSSDGAGHVAIVEEIKSDGTIITSNSNFGGERFFLREIKPPYDYNGLTFQGFIYLPIEFEEEKATSTNFLGSKGYFSKGDTHENIGKIASFMRKTFPAYTNKKALGNYYGKYIEASIKEFQKRTKLQSDGKVGPKTLAELKKYGFKEN